MWNNKKPQSIFTRLLKDQGRRRHCHGHRHLWSCASANNSVSLSLSYDECECEYENKYQWECEYNRKQTVALLNSVWSCCVCRDFATLSFSYIVSMIDERCRHMMSLGCLFDEIICDTAKGLWSCDIADNQRTYRTDDFSRQKDKSLSLNVRHRNKVERSLRVVLSICTHFKMTNTCWHLGSHTTRERGTQRTINIETILTIIARSHNWLEEFKDSSVAFFLSCWSGSYGQFIFPFLHSNRLQINFPNPL